MWLLVSIHAPVRDATLAAPGRSQLLISDQFGAYSEGVRLGSVIYTNVAGTVREIGGVLAQETAKALHKIKINFIKVSIRCEFDKEVQPVAICIDAGFRHAVS